MKITKKLLSLLLAVAMLLSVASVISGCGKDSAGNEDPTDPANVEKDSYTVTIKTAGGMPMIGVAAYIYADATLSDLKDYGETDENGTVSFNLPVGTDYAIDLESVPKGYQVAESYSFSGNKADIALTSALIEGENLSGASLGLGDIMYDFSVTDNAGVTTTLSEVLKEKKMALLNFFYTTCGPCVTEFPYMQEAYEAYQDKVGIIALDPMDQAAAVEGFKSSMGLTFPMVACQPAWSATFSVSGYPTSIVVDRYGMICLIEKGGLTSSRPFNSIFEAFSADDYQQKIYTSLDEVVVRMKPNVEMPAPEEIAGVLNKGDIAVTYRDETSDEYSWPFVLTEKNGQKCLASSNSKIEASYSMVFADVTLKAGEAFGFDYLISSEKGADVFHVIVDDEPIYAISGVSTPEEWKTAYPWVAPKDGTYELKLAYIKDDTTDEGDDTVYMKNFRIVNTADIDTPTYIPKYASNSDDGFEYTYVDIAFNEKDGYYHVGDANGPLLLADLKGHTNFAEDTTLWDIAYNGDITEDGHNYYDDLVQYFSYATNSSLEGVCTVNKELAELLKKVDQIVGFDENDTNEWLRFCKYYQAYGTNGEQLEDPIKGLATFSAYEAKLGKNVATNFLSYSKIIMPRGKYSRFTPAKSGVYRITSRAESAQGVEAWIFNDNRELLLTYEMNERMWNDSDNVSMLYYMEAGKNYYIDIAFWDPHEAGTIKFDIEFMGASYEVFKLASQGYFTYDTNATGDAMYHTIAGGIKVVQKDGYYYEDLGKDANGNQRYGSMLYADFTGVTSLFSAPIATVKGVDGNAVQGMIDKGGFDFSKTENDLYVLSYLKQNDNDPDKTREYFKTLWAEDFDANAEEYKIEEVFAGKYHGKGPDLTGEIKGYLTKMYSGSAKEREGCVPVDTRLAEILQLLMDKYTFENVDNSWTKLCYYYDYLGPNG